jgi:GNAT superfamily N-acetyltransferase
MTEIAIRTGDDPALETLLAERIYEYNAAATGYHDGETFTAVHRSDAGEVDAGTSGYTWGGCCYVAYLWVAAARRGRGFGSALLDAVERHARAKGCGLVFLSTHSFQAPAFYARRGYELAARIDDHPPGHASLFYVKRLDAR